MGQAAADSPWEGWESFRGESILDFEGRVGLLKKGQVESACVWGAAGAWAPAASACTDLVSWGFVQPVLTET